MASSESPESPMIVVSESAKKALEAAVRDAGPDSLRVRIDAQFQHELYLGPREPDDVEVRASALTLLIDRSSVGRAHGLCIDFVDGPSGGFKIDNPNAPPSVKQLSALELKGMLDRQEIILFDVRPESERAIAAIAQARPLDAAGQEYMLGLDRGTPIALHCHHGIRSQAAAQRVLREGFRHVYNLKGGIEAWTESVDPSVPRY